MRIYRIFDLLAETVRENLNFRNVVTAVIASGLMLGLYQISRFNFLLFHTLAEIFAIWIAIGTWIVAWNARHFLDNKIIPFLGIAYLFVGLIDLGYTLTIPGINVIPVQGANTSNQLWLAARYLQAGSLLVAPLITRKRFNHRWVFLSYAALTLALLGSILLVKIFPSAVIEGTSFTNFKIGSEYLIAIILVFALILLLAIREDLDARVRWFLALSIVLTVFSELAFARNASSSDWFDTLGHLLKIVAFYLIYKAVIETALTRPYTLLFRNLQKSRDELQKERDFIAAVFNTTNALVVVSESNGRIARVNQACEQITGLPSGKLLGCYLWEISLVGEDHEQVKELLSNPLTDASPINHESCVTDSDQTEHELAWTSTAFTNREGTRYIISVGIDISERKQVEKELRFLSTHDILTGLYNRTHFEAEMVRLAGTDRFPASIVVLDVDSLKEVNDTYGHAMGDKLIQRAAGILKTAFRTTDIIARVGGDEFAVLLPESDDFVAEQARKRVKAILRAHNRKHTDLPISLSSGAASAAAGYQLMETFKKADKSMYLEKSSRHKHLIEEENP